MTKRYNYTNFRNDNMTFEVRYNERNSYNEFCVYWYRNGEYQGCRFCDKVWLNNYLATRNLK